MNKLLSATKLKAMKRPQSNAKAWRVAIWVIGFCLTSSSLLAAPIKTNAPIRIAVTPFVGTENGMSIARALTSQLARRELDRLIAPGDFVAVANLDPRAKDIRHWAYNAAVDTIVVGQISAYVGEGSATPVAGAWTLDAALRSGHSGAELSRHQVVVGRGEKALGAAVEKIALAILADLGHVDSVLGEVGIVAAAPAAPVNSSDSAGAPSDGTSAARGKDGSRSQAGFRNDAPIEIKADEAEIINREEGRKLIFQRNVRVRQGNITLHSDRLEAQYRKGESEPHELRAEGRVHIDQGDRQADCDHAVYLREENRLVCRGHAELIQGCDIVRGELIEIDLAGEEARVEGAASIVIQPEKEANTDCVAGKKHS